MTSKLCSTIHICSASSSESPCMDEDCVVQVLSVRVDCLYVSPSWEWTLQVHQLLVGLQERPCSMRSWVSLTIWGPEMFLRLSKTAVTQVCHITAYFIYLRLSMALMLCLQSLLISKGLLDVCDVVQCLVELAQAHAANPSNHKWLVSFHMASVETFFQASFCHGVPLCLAGLGTEAAQHPFRTSWLLKNR